jgi:hypothetical protein
MVGNSVKEGEMPSAEEWKKLVVKSLQVFGVPSNNISRLVTAVKLHAEDIANGEFLSFEAGKDKSKAQALYDAIVSENADRVEKAEGAFDDQAAIESAMRNGLRNNDSRIKEAAKALNTGDIRGYGKYLKDIASEGHFDEETIEGAIRAERSAFNSKINEAAEHKTNGKDKEYKDIVVELRESYRGIYSQDEIVALIKKAQNEQLDTEDDDTEEVTSIYRGSDINDAFEYGDNALAKSIISELIDTKVANGMEEKNAKSSVRSSMTSYWKPLYKAAYKAGNAEEMRRIRMILKESGIYGRNNDILDTCKGWLNEK